VYNAPKWMHLTEDHLRCYHLLNWWLHIFVSSYVTTAKHLGVKPTFLMLLSSFVFV